MRYIFLGSPSKQVSALASILATCWRILHVPVGDLLKEEIAGRTSVGNRARLYVDAGKRVPDSLLVTLMRRQLEDLDTRAGWIVDGFPTALAQARALDRLLAITGHAQPIVVYFEPPVGVALEGASAGSLQDEREAAARHRLELDRANTAALIDFYQKRNRLVKINSSLSLEEIICCLQNSILGIQSIFPCWTA